MEQLRVAMKAAFAMPKHERLELALTARVAARSGTCFPIKGWGAAMMRVHIILFA